jgi:VWFA-related protein
MRKALVFLVCLAAAGLSSAQDPRPPETPVQGPTFRTGVDLITVDVAVVDSKGLPVEDLRAPEFSVKIDGETRRVVSAELVKVDVEEAKKQAAAESDSFYTSNLTPIHGRQILLAVDQVRISPSGIRPILAAATKFLEKLTPLDQVGFIAFPEPGPKVNFTNDRLRLKLAMERLVGQYTEMRTSQFNIGLSEAIDIADKSDQLTLAFVLSRECRGLTGRAREDCEREVLSESSQIAQKARTEASISLRALEQILQQLTVVEGPKALILISESLAIQEPSELDRVIRLAGLARTSINVMLVDLSRNDVTISEQPPTMAADRRIQSEGLQALAAMSRGALYHVTGTGENIFDRLASELSAYYVLGVEQRPGDQDRERSRIDVEVRRRDVTIRSRQAFVLSAAPGPKRSTEDTLRDALISPFGTTGLPVRVTTFAQKEPKSDKVRITIAAHVGQPGSPAGEYTVGYLVVNDENRVVASNAFTQTLAPAGTSPNEPLEFAGAVLLDPGVYSLRFGVVDAEGRRGSVIRDVSAWKLDGDTLSMSDLIVGNLPASGQGLRPNVEPHVTADTVATYIEVYSSAPATLEGTSIVFDIAEENGGPPLATFPARLTPGTQPAARLATGVIGARALPPGRYLARAQIMRDGKAVGSLARPFVLERAAGAAEIAPAAVTAAAVSFASTLPKFTRETSLRPDVLGSILDMVEKRSADLKDAMVEARAGRYGSAAVEALSAGDQETAAFLRGLDLFTKGQLEQAAQQLDIASGPRRQFFPAAFYLGAIFAEVGRDRDAAGVWQIALGSEPRPAAVYAMVADARLRDGQPGSAIDILKPAYDRNPANDDVAKRLGLAYVMTGRWTDALPVLDSYLSRNAADQDLLLASITAHYEAARGGVLFSNADHAKLRKYAAAYRGPQAVLVDKYLETIQSR